MNATRFTSIQIIFLVALVMLFLWGGTGQVQESGDVVRTPNPQYFLKRDQTHNKFSRKIAPVLRVPSNTVIEAKTEEASDKQVTLGSNVKDLTKMDFNPIHPLSKKIFQ